MWVGDRFRTGSVLDEQRSEYDVDKMNEMIFVRSSSPPPQQTILDANLCKMNGSYVFCSTIMDEN